MADEMTFKAAVKQSIEAGAARIKDEAEAERRFNEERAQDSRTDFEETFADMIERDRRDSTRTDSPLKAADDAILVDSTGLSINEVFEHMMEIVKEKSGGRLPS